LHTHCIHVLPMILGINNDYFAKKCYLCNGKVLFSLKKKFIFKYYLDQYFSTQIKLTTGKIF
jgi:hypothetical protein